ncbi:MAG: zinc finger protein [Umezawaea sp.]
MGTRPFRWFPSQGRRHAIPDALGVADEGATLCGVAITVPRDRGTKTAWCWPTCTTCDAVWREREGLPDWLSRSR